jgi:hypothetical protein
VGEQKKKKKKETHPRGQSLGLGFIPSKNPKGDVLDGALVGCSLLCHRSHKIEQDRKWNTTEDILMPQGTPL